MKVVCAWCKNEIGEKESVFLDTSHGICPTCMSIYFPDHTPVIEDGMTPLEQCLLAFALAAVFVVVFLFALRGW